MRKSSKLRCFRCLALCAPFASLSAAPALAQQPESAPVTAPQSRALRVYVDVGQSGVDAEAVRRAVSRELNSEVELAATAETPLRVTIGGDERAQVFYKNESGEELSRTIELPQNAERRVEVIALMVGNLTRNEAAELLAALKPAPAEKPPEAPAAKPPPPQKPEPKPAPPQAPPSPRKSPSLGNGYLYAERPGLNASLFHPISLLRDSERRVLAIELSAAYGHVGAIQGVGFSLGALNVEHQLQGIALGLGMTKVQGPMRGLQLSVLYNETHGEQIGIDISGVALQQRSKLTGIAIAGLGALTDDIDGIGIAGLVDVAHDLRGLHVGGLASIATGDVVGLQGAGLVNWSEAFTGFSVAGLGTRASRTSGVAVSSLINLTGDLDGVSAGLINVGGRVRGMQIGLVNIAREVHGFQLGVANYSRDNGDIQVIAFGSNVSPFNAGLKFTTGYTYSEFGVGGNLSTKRDLIFAGLGLHAPLGRLSFDVGGRISTTDDTDPNTSGPLRTDVHYLGRANIELIRGLEVFGGGGVRQGVIGEGAGHTSPEFLGGVALF